MLLSCEIRYHCSEYVTSVNSYVSVLHDEPNNKHINKGRGKVDHAVAYQHLYFIYHFDFAAFYFASF